MEKESIASFLQDAKLQYAKPNIKSDYLFLGELGSGVTSTVFLAVNLNTKEQVAVKAIAWGIVKKSPKLAGEIEILRSLDHPNIVHLLDLYYDDTFLYIVMELARGKELFEEICSRRSFTEEDARAIIEMLLNALNYVHKKKIIHRDIKPENIIFNHDIDGKKTSIKLIDFGFASNCDLINPLDTSAGTLGYKAPEIYQQRPYSTKADMWSVGVIAYILLVGFPPFFSCHEWSSDYNTLMNTPFWFLFNQKTDELVEAIVDGKYEFPTKFWSKISIAAIDFIRCCLQKEPEKRFSAEDALRHVWIEHAQSDSKRLGVRSILAQFAHTTVAWQHQLAELRLASGLRASQGIESNASSPNVSHHSFPTHFFSHLNASNPGLSESSEKDFEEHVLAKVSYPEENKVTDVTQINTQINKERATLLNDISRGGVKLKRVIRLSRLEREERERGNSANSGTEF